jgi:hypothetical protein
LLLTRATANRDGLSGFSGSLSFQVCPFETVQFIAISSASVRLKHMKTLEIFFDYI